MKTPYMKIKPANKCLSCCMASLLTKSHRIRLHKPTATHFICSYSSAVLRNEEKCALLKPIIKKNNETRFPLGGWV